MKRKNKYYISTKDGVSYRGFRRLTKYYDTKIEADNEFDHLRLHYDTLFLRVLSPDNKTRDTLKTIY